MKDRHGRRPLRFIVQAHEPPHHAMVRSPASSSCARLAGHTKRVDAWPADRVPQLLGVGFIGLLELGTPACAAACSAGPSPASAADIWAVCVPTFTANAAAAASANDDPPPPVGVAPGAGSPPASGASRLSPPRTTTAVGIPQWLTALASCLRSVMRWESRPVHQTAAPFRGVSLICFAR